MKEGKKRKFHYAWLILAGCCILQGTSLGLLSNCAGVFYSPVCTDLGFEMGEFAFYRTVFAISSALMLPAAAKSFQKADVRIVISLAAVIYGISSAAMGSFHDLKEWYLAGVLQGASSAFLCMVPAPILLNNWFHKKTGTAVGISAAFSGFMGMAGSSALGVMIPALGWRASYGIMGVLSMALILPVSGFVLRYRPEDMGMKAYGAEEEEPRRVQDGEKKDGMKARELFTQPVFYVALAAYAGTIASAYFNMFLTSCGLEAGLPMALAAMLTTLSLLGNMVSKLILGKASDTYGAARTFEVSVLVSVAGLLLVYMGNPGSVMAGALLFGITQPLSSVMMPLFCKLFWKGESYGTAFSYVSMFGTLIASPFNMVFGKFYDITGTYSLTIAASGFLILMVLILVWAGDRLLKKPSLQAQ